MSKRILQALSFVLIILVLFSLILISVNAESDAANSEKTVAVKEAVIISESNVIGDSTVNIINDNEIVVSTGTFTQPGAFVELMITVENNSSQIAYLRDIDEFSQIPDYISLDFPKLSTSNEKIMPNTQCSFSVVISWDSQSVVNVTETEYGVFDFKLFYEYDNQKLTASPDMDIASAKDLTTPKTGYNNSNLLYLLVFATAVFALYIYLKKRDSFDN